MQYFNERMFNPDYINSTYYQANYATIQQNYQKEQSIHVVKLVKAFNDMLDEVQQMDDEHQMQAFSLCLEEIARRNGWINDRFT